MYKYLIRISVNDISEEGRNKIYNLIPHDKCTCERLSMENFWYYFYLEYENIHDADRLIDNLLRIKEVQKEYPYNSQIAECYIVTNKLKI